MKARRHQQLDGPNGDRARDFRNRPVGAVIGLVSNNVDPKGWGRVKVRFPWLHDGEESHWARIAQPYAGAGRGSFWLPEVGDEVAVVFDRGDPNHPYVLGGLWNGEDAVPPPGNPDGENNHKVFRTRVGHQLIFEDTAGGEKITLTDGVNGRHLVIDVAADTITLTTEPGDINFSAPSGTFKVRAKNIGISVQGSSTIKVDGKYQDSAGGKTENIGGSDTVTLASLWQTTAGTVTTNAQVSALNAVVFGATVAGALSMSNSGGRTIKAKKVVRTTSAPETMIAAKVEIEVEGTAAFVVNGPISLAGGAMNFESADATFATGAALTVMGGVVNLEAKAGMTASAQIVKLC